MATQFAAATIPNTEVRTLRSSFVGQEFKIFLAFPDDYHASDRTYPVLYVLDGNGSFGTLTETVRILRLMQQVPDMLIVGIGYPLNSFKATQGLRVRDLTPTEDRAWLDGFERAQPGLFETDGSGGASNFLEFIKVELIPFLQSDYRLDSGGAALAGHSFGGLFTLYTLLHAPTTFDRYIISSPSIWWDPTTVLEYEARYALENSDLPAKVFMSAGSLEESMVPPFRNQPAAFVSHVQSMATRLQGRNYAGLDLTTHIFDGEMHVSVAPAAMSRGLRVVFG